MRHLILALCLGFLLQACTPKQFGQMIYNSFKSYCHDNPSRCTDHDREEY